MPAPFQPIPISLATRPLPVVQDPPPSGDTPSRSTAPSRTGPAPAATGTQQPAQPSGGSAPPSPFSGGFLWLMMGAILLMLFFSSRKESKARKAQQQMLASIKQGDHVVTSAGIHGTVHKLDESTVTLLLDSARVTFDRASIARVLRDDATRTA